LRFSVFQSGRMAEAKNTAKVFVIIIDWNADAGFHI
jgi:hypothetical protein